MAIRLADLGEKWTKDCSSVEEIRDLMVLEQFTRSLTPEIRMWVRERKPKKVADAAQLADQFAQARKLEKASFDFGTRQKELSGRRDSRPGKEGKRKPTTCFNCGETGHYRRNCPKTATDNKPAADKLPTDDKPRETKTKACYNCRKRGHLAWQCNSSMLCQDHVTHDQGVCRTGKVEGKLVADIILDTGCTKSLVRSDLVPTEAVTGSSQAVTIRCAHGDTVLYPLATISVEVDGLCFSVCAAVSDTLPVSLLLGTDISALGNLLQTPVLKGASEQTVAISEPARTTTTESEPIILTSTAEVLVVTRAQSKRAEDALSFMHNLPFAGIDDNASVFPACRPEKKSLTRREKRLARKKYCGTPETVDKVIHHPLDMTPQELQGLQENDPTLVKARKVADGQRSTEAGDGFFWKNDLLYRKWTPIGRNEEMVVDQIVLPKSCRQQVLHLAHTIPLAGHLGCNKTAHQVMRRFYWPTLFRDVADYCRRCPECQRSGGQREQRAPLMPLPILGVPFERIAMDIVGPLPRSRAGHKYILVVCDYATRFPEAFPLTQIDAVHIADKLVDLFSRVGIPKEILTDCGSNFTLELLTEIYRLLHVHPIRTTPYHPQTDGLVERFNKTLKSLLRKTVSETGKDWDRLLPYLLFAYREVPQASTGFSPFELLYGRDVRGPLDVLKERWEVNSATTESVVSHLLQMRERMEQMTGLVKENMRRAQRTQKTWYDQGTRSREFQTGDQVLILLPSSALGSLARSLYNNTKVRETHIPS